MDDIYIAALIKNGADFHKGYIVIITDIGEIHKFVTSGNYRVFKLSCLPEVIRVETTVVDNSTVVLPVPDAVDNSVLPKAILRRGEAIR